MRGVERRLRGAATTHGACVCMWQVGDVRKHISDAFPSADSLVLDSEILLVDKHGNLLKFGSLGA